MIVTIEQPSEEVKVKLKALDPNFDVEVTEVTEFEMPWYHRQYWTLLWFGFVMWICETIVPDLKKDPNFIRISLKKSHK